MLSPCSTSSHAISMPESSMWFSRTPPSIAADISLNVKTFTPPHVFLALFLYRLHFLPKFIFPGRTTQQPLNLVSLYQWSFRSWIEKIGSLQWLFTFNFEIMLDLQDAKIVQRFLYISYQLLLRLTSEIP